MTDQPASRPTEPAPGGSAGTPPPTATFEQRMEDLGRRAGEAGERFGREAEAAGKRLASDPSVQGAADTAGRVWGLIVLAVGSWFFVDITLGYDMPSIPWRDLWPLALILIGLVVIVRAMGRRRA